MDGPRSETIERCVDAPVDEEGMSHRVCHCDNYRVAYCGKDCGDNSEVFFDGEDAECVVCADVDNRTGGACPRCGYIH